jgi:hypothetical protein
VSVCTCLHEHDTSEELILNLDVFCLVGIFFFHVTNFRLGFYYRMAF